MTAGPPREERNDSATETGTPSPFFSAFFSAFSAEALGLSVKLTAPAAATGRLPLANTIFAGLHLPASFTRPALQRLDAKAPNRPLANVASQLNVPGSATLAVKEIAPVAGISVPARATNALSGAGVSWVFVSTGSETGACVEDEVDDVGVVGLEGPGGVGTTPVGVGETVTVAPAAAAVEPVRPSFGVIVTVYSPTAA